MKRLCRLLGVSRQAHFKHDPSRLMRKRAQEEFAVEYIKEVRRKAPGIGGKKLWLMYRRDFSGSNPLGRDRFEDVIYRYGLKVRRKQRKPRTTDSRHGLRTYPDLTRTFIPSKPNQLWVSDITYIPIHQNDSYTFSYLSLVLDAYSEEIIGWSVGMTLETEYPVRALTMALERLKNEPSGGRRLIHHSDRGTQYASAWYVRLLQEHDVRISMTETGDPKDNAKAERINNTIKNELLRGMTFTTIEELRATLDAAIHFYNEERPHMSIDMMTPVEAAKREGEIRKRWTSYREGHIRAAMQQTAFNS